MPSLIATHNRRRPCTATLLTSRGRGAVASIAVEGNDAQSLVAEFFRPLGRKKLTDLPVNRIVVGHWRGLNGAVEEVVVSRRNERCVEVNCHGGHAASDAILESLASAGAMRTGPNGWLANRVGDHLKRAAWLRLTDAKTPRTAGILLDQFRGALRNSVTDVVERLGEDSSGESRELALQKLDRLISLSSVGLHLTEPWRVVITGPPNVGKSCLLNALVGYQRAIVFDQPGTTRDVLQAATALDGWPVELIDTAGLRESTDPIEREGVHRAKSQLESADLILAVRDATSSASSDYPSEVADRVIHVANKCDLLVAGSQHPLGEQAVFTSATTGAGVASLMKVIVERLVPAAPQLGEAVPFEADQVDLLKEMLDAASEYDASRVAEIGRRLLTGDAQTAEILQ